MDRDGEEALVTPAAELDVRNQAQMSAASAIYSPLYDNQIRIVFLEPSDVFDGPLVAKLRTAELLYGPGVLVPGKERNVAEYTALSYCWGPPIFEKEFWLNGYLYPITQSLFDALQHLRGKEIVVPLWIDALCINQWDLEERSKQITNIITIFSKAFEVIGWVGIPSPQIKEVLQALTEGNFKGYESAEDEMPEDDSAEDDSAEDDIAEDDSAEDGDAANEIITNGFRELFQRPWFRRVWVKQEVFAAKKLYLQCGSVKIEWNRLEHFELPEFTYRDATTKRDIEVGEMQNPFLGGDYTKNTTDIVNVLRRTADSDASDARDFVYGILGMTRTNLKVVPIDDDDYDLLPIDYSRTVGQVFVDVTRYVMNRDNCLNVLLLKGKFGGSIDGCELPSWVPDWRLTTSTKPWLEYAAEDIKKGMKNSRRAARFRYAGGPLTDHTDNTTLNVRGMLLGHVIATDSEPNVKELSAWQLSRLDAIDLLDEQDKLKLRKDFPTAFENFETLVNRELLKYDTSESSEPYDWPCNAPLRIDITPEDHSSTTGHTFTIMPEKHWITFARYNLEIASVNYFQYFLDFTVSPKSRASRRHHPRKPGDHIYAKTSISRCTVVAQQFHDRLRKLMLGKVDNPAPRDYGLRWEKWHAVMWHSFVNHPQEWIPEAWAVPESTEAGDAIVLLESSTLPMVFRAVPGTTHYRYVGAAALTEWVELEESPSYREYDSKQKISYPWPHSGDRYEFLYRLLDIYEEDGTLQTFHII